MRDNLNRKGGDTRKGIANPSEKHFPRVRGYTLRLAVVDRYEDAFPACAGTHAKMTTKHRNSGYTPPIVAKVNSTTLPRVRRNTPLASSFASGF